MRNNLYVRHAVDVSEPPKPHSMNRDGEGKIAAFTPTNPFYSSGVVKNIDGKYYFGVMGREDKNRDPYIYRYNPLTDSIEQEQRIQVGITTQDTHRVPSLGCDSSGNIYVCFEQLINGVYEHGSTIRIYKTTVPYDLTTLVLLSTITGRWTYPHILINGSNVFVGARGSTDTVNFIRGEYWYSNSSNNATSFSAAVKLYDSGNEDLVAYIELMYDYNGGVYAVLNERDNVRANWTLVAVFKGSFGSNTWTNLSGSFSKDVSTSGAITRAEMLANCLITESSNYDTIAVNFEGGVVKSDGSIKALISVQSLTGNVYVGNPEGRLDELRFYSYNAGWTFNNVTIPANMVFYWAYERLFQYVNNDEAFDDIIFIDNTTVNNVYIKRSVDDFATETDTLKLAGNDYYRLGQGAFNASSEDDYFFVLINTVPPADSFEIENEGAEDYSNILLLRP